MASAASSLGPVGSGAAHDRAARALRDPHSRGSGRPRRGFARSVSSAGRPGGSSTASPGRRIGDRSWRTGPSSRSATRRPSPPTGTTSTRCAPSSSGWRTRSAAGCEAPGSSGRTVTLKVRFGDFTTITRSHSLTSPLQSSAEIAEIGSALLAGTRLGRGVRLIGITVSSLETACGRRRGPPAGASGSSSSRAGRRTIAIGRWARSTRQWTRSAGDTAWRPSARPPSSSSGGLRVKALGDTAWGPAAARSAGAQGGADAHRSLADPRRRDPPRAGVARPRPGEPPGPRCGPGCNLLPARRRSGRLWQNLAFVSGAPPPRGNVNHAAGMPECAVNEGVPTGREGGVGAAFRGGAKNPPGDGAEALRARP